jgi:WD40 repeat protein
MQALQSWELPGTPTSLAWSPDSGRFFAMCQARARSAMRFVIVDARSGEVLRSWRAWWRHQGDQTAWSPGGDLVACLELNTVAIDHLTKRTSFTLKPSGSPVGFAFSPSGSRIAVGGSDGKVHVWDLDAAGPEAKQQLVLTGPPGDVNCLAWSHDGARLAGGVTDPRTLHGVLCLWGARRGKLLARIAEANVRGIAFSPDGHQLASVSRRGAVKLWSGFTGELEDDLTSLCKGGPAHGLSWSRQGLLAVAKGDLIVLNPPMRKVLRRFRPVAD